VNVYIAPLAQAAFAVNGFPLPEVDEIVDSQGKRGFRAVTVKEVDGRFAWAVMLSPRSADDAADRLAREILRNRQ
jgi:hypothetical protein